MKHSIVTYLLVAFACIVSTQVHAQADSLSLEEEFAPSISLNPAKGAEQKKKAKAKQANEPKPPKGVFYGMATRKVILKAKKGRNIITEKFYILRQYKHPSVYVKKHYYFDPSSSGGKRKIREIVDIGEKYGIPVHGPYEKRINGEVREKGIYYMGVKHGRWVSYGPDYRLLDKVKYDKGFPKGSRIAYYDNKNTKIKEVTPIVNGEREGMYYEFYPSGRVKVEGLYKDNKKVGQWHEFYDSHMKLRQRIVQHPKDPEDNAESYILKEWNSRGKIITDNSGGK